jgi:hypothetical protein
MQKIFEDAKAHLQKDMAFASGPGGSIESRLPSGRTPLLSEASSRILSVRQDDSPPEIRYWRYSTAPGLLAQAHIDVREPFPEGEPMLPDLAATIVAQVESPAPEPFSSGFNSPEDHEMGEGHTEIDPVLPPLPDTSPLASRFVDMDAIAARHSSSSPCQRTPLLTNLEAPLTEMEINRTSGRPTNDDDVLPAIAYMQSQSASPEVLGDSGEASNNRQIFLSTPAKAAAESARAKRGLERSGLRSASDKENIRPEMICPDPSAHTDRKVIRCPNLRRHTHGYGPRTRSSTPSNFDRQNGQHTPNPYVHNYQPSPSPFRASLCPPAPHYRRTDSTGSPLPVLKQKSPPPSPGPNTFRQRQSYFSTGQSEYPRPPTTIVRPPTGSGPRKSDAEHFQPGWSHYPSEEPPKPKSLTYAFSTAAAKQVGSSQAPDLRIRDSYRTDTLTPLSRPASRFKKNGIGAIAARGASHPHPTGSYSPWPSTTGPGNGRPRIASSSHQQGMASPDRPRFMSSPPRQSDHSNCMPTKRRRPKDSSRDFDIAEDSTVASVPGTPMEIDDDIQAAVRMSIAGVPDTPADDLALPGLAGVRQLSPNVSPFRKGRDMPAKRLRTASYWDHDLPEVRRIDQARMKRPATMEAGTPRVKSMRISGIMSSPPRRVGPNRSMIASRGGTVASASIYSQAGMSEMSRPHTRARGSDEKIRTDGGDEMMGDVEEGDTQSDYTKATVQTVAVE